MHVIIIAIYGAHLTGCFYPTKKKSYFSALQVQKFYVAQIYLVFLNAQLPYSHKTDICQKNKRIQVQWRHSCHANRN